MNSLKFRNITASVDDPVEAWPFEGILAAVERGTLPDWRRLAAAIRDDPFGPVAQQVLVAVRLSRPYGTTELFEEIVKGARRELAAAERELVAARVRELVKQSGLPRSEFAQLVGTSRPRLATYISGRVVPSAALMVRMGMVTDRARAAAHRMTRGDAPPPEGRDRRS